MKFKITQVNHTKEPWWEFKERCEGVMEALESQGQIVVSCQFELTIDSGVCFIVTKRPL